MNSTTFDRIPKKVLRALQANGIRSAVAGYTTRIGDRCNGTDGVAFTAWDDNGNVVCVLHKRPGEAEWRIVK